MLLKAAFCLLNVGLALAAPAPVAAASTAVRTSAPSGALEVGSGAKYTKIQDAVDALSTSSTTAQSIFIKPGTYNEQVLIPARKAALTVYGYTVDTSSYKENKVTITHGIGLDSAKNDDETGTLRVKASNFKMYNVNVANTRGQGSQAIAISAWGSNQGYYGCSFIGFQDTVLAQLGTQIYAGCYIEGATDFIFGQHASAWFTGCDIRVLPAKAGYVTASGRSSTADTSYYVLDKCNIAAKSGQKVTKGSYYLGRPWAEYARVTVQDTSMTEVINTAGWSVWSTKADNTGHVSFLEYNNTGAGSKGTRASFSKKIASKVSMSTVLGDKYASEIYVDASWL